MFIQRTFDDHKPHVNPMLFLFVFDCFISLGSKTCVTDGQDAHLIDHQPGAFAKVKILVPFKWAD